MPSTWVVAPNSSDFLGLTRSVNDMKGASRSCCGSSKYSAYALAYRRGEGPVGFALFDETIDDIFVFCGPGIRENAAIAEGAGTELEDLPCTQPITLPSAMRLAARTAMPGTYSKSRTTLQGSSWDSIASRQQISVPQYTCPICGSTGRLDRTLGVKRGSDGAAGVVGGRLNEDALKHAGVKEFTVQCGVVSDSASDANIWRSGLHLKMTDYVKGDLFEGFL